MVVMVKRWNRVGNCFSVLFVVRFLGSLQIGVLTVVRIGE